MTTPQSGMGQTVEVGVAETKPSRLLPRRASKSRAVQAIARHAVTIAIVIIMLYPVIWMVDNSFKPNAFVGRTLLPLQGPFTLKNYISGLTPRASLNIGVSFLNSFIIGVLSVIGNLFACSLVGYAFGRLEFAGKRILFTILIGMLLLPYQVTIVPQYILFHQLGWLNTYLPLVVPKYLATDAFFVYLMVQFVRGLPRDLDEAARIDGCGDFGVFWRIVLPLLSPAIATTATFTFIHAWNDFLGPRLYISDMNRYTVSQALVQFIDSTGQSSVGGLFAMATLSVIPLIGFFLATQRWLTEGIATTGFK